MVKNEELRKLFAALIVPMDQDENVDYGALEALVRQELEEGVEGFYVCGSSGEGLLLTLEERQQILEHTVRAADGKVPVVAHVGTIRTRDAADLAVHAMNHGAAAVSMIPPYYYHFSMEEITRYYEDVIGQLTDAKVIVYNIPQFTGIEFNKQNADRLLSNPGIIGIKHTSNNLYSMERIKQAYPEKVMFNGFDEQYLGSLAMGADAAIGTTINLFAPLFHEVRRLFMEGKMAEARKVQEKIDHNVEVMCRYGIFNATKYLASRKGVPCGSCRRPFAPLSAEAKQKLDELVGE